MAAYVEINGLTHLQLDTGGLVPCNVNFSLDGGNLMKLPAEQLEQIKPIVPNFYPLPIEQVIALREVSVANFPAAFGVSNFPSAFGVSNLPSAYPLPAAQETMLNAIRESVTGYTKGFGNLDATTLRVVIAANQPSIPVLLPSGTLSYRALGNVSTGVIKATSGFLFSLTCTNLATQTRYLQLFNANQIVNTGAVPLEWYPVYANGGFLSLVDELGRQGLAFTTGITWGFSSTPNTFTAANSVDCAVIARYS
jgi:hypothetical protein